MSIDVLSSNGLKTLDEELEELLNQSFPRLEVKNLNAAYGDHQALNEISMPIYNKEILALIGPSGCGKSTFLRCLNRLNDLIRGFKISGKVIIDNQDIYAPNVDTTILRRRVGLVFQNPNPFPMSVFDNVAFGVREINSRIKKDKLAEIVEESLKEAGLWGEVKDKLNGSGLSLSGGQQQRLCIARALAVKPEVLLLDEPCASLDPISTGHIEDLLIRLKEHYTIVIVTHNLAQAHRVSGRMAFFLNGRLVEHGITAEMAVRPRFKETEDYLCGNFG